MLVQLSRHWEIYTDHIQLKVSTANPLYIESWKSNRLGSWLNRIGRGTCLHITALGKTDRHAVEPDQPTSHMYMYVWRLDLLVSGWNACYATYVGWVGENIYSVFNRLRLQRSPVGLTSTTYIDLASLLNRERKITFIPTFTRFKTLQDNDLVGGFPIYSYYVHKSWLAACLLNVFV